MDYHVVVRTLSEQPTAVIRGRVRTEEISEWLPAAYAELFGYLDRTGVPPAAPPFARYTFLADGFDLEAGVPVAGAVPGEGRVTSGMLPGGPVAVTLHVGPYDQLEAALEAVQAAVRERGGEPAGAHWEVYLTDPAEAPDPAGWRTEVVQPFRS